MVGTQACGGRSNGTPAHRRISNPTLGVVVAGPSLALKEVVEMGEPRLVEVKDGWAALGDGWAVFGRTPADARKLFGAAEDKHAELRARTAEPQTASRAMIVLDSAAPKS